MQVENVTRIGFASRRAAKEQRHGAVGHGVLGKVIVDHQRVAAAVAEVFTHRGPGERSEVLESVGVRRTGHDDDRVLESAVFAQGFHHAGHVGHLLADGDIDAVDRVRIAALVGGLLVQDGVNADRRLTGLAVANDEFALAATNRNHRVHGLDPRLQGFGDRLAVHNARGIHFDERLAFGGDGAEPVQRLTQRVHHAAEHGFAHGHFHDAAGAAHFLAFLDFGGVTQKHDPDGVFFQVESQARHAAREVEHFAHLAAGEAVNAGNAVAHLDNGADFVGGVLVLVALQFLLQDGGDFFGSDGHSRRSRFRLGLKGL